MKAQLLKTSLILSPISHPIPTVLHEKIKDEYTSNRHLTKTGKEQSDQMWKSAMQELHSAG